VDVGAGDCDGHGQTGSLGDQVDLRPVLALVNRIRTCQILLFKARVFAESMAHLDQSNSPQDPSSSRTRWCSLAQTRAFVHSVNPRWVVAPDGPNDAVGNCCHVQPDVATNAIVARTSRSP
jgi:hypothetical protein